MKIKFAREMYIELSGITQVWINKTICWRKINDNCWKKVEGGGKFNPDKNVTKTAFEFNKMVNRRINKTGDAGDRWREPMYRVWVSEHTLNIVKKDIVIKLLKTHEFK